MKKRLYYWARTIRYFFLLITGITFIAGNIGLFAGQPVWMYIFLVTGILWLFSTIYVESIDIKEDQKEQELSVLKSENYMFLCDLQGGENTVLKWMKYHASLISMLIVLGAAITLYYVTIDIWWVAALIIVGPISVFIASRIERMNTENNNFIRQVKPIVVDVRSLETSIRTFTQDLLAQQVAINQVGVLGIQGWKNYFTSLGDEQIDAINLLENVLNRIDPAKEQQINTVIISLKKILGRILGAESQVTTVLCSGINNLPMDMKTAWKYIQQEHERLSSQLSTLRPVLNNRVSPDLFDTFIKQHPRDI
jgi:hypothetical protein